jgi:hypothetical protein
MCPPGDKGEAFHHGVAGGHGPCRRVVHGERRVEDIVLRQLQRSRRQNGMKRVIKQTVQCTQTEVIVYNSSVFWIRKNMNPLAGSGITDWIWTWVGDSYTTKNCFVSSRTSRLLKNKSVT